MYGRMPNCCLTLSQVEVVKNDSPKVLSARRLSSASRTRMPIRAAMITPPATRATPWKTVSAVTLVARWVTRRGAAPGGATPVISRTAAAGTLLVREGGAAIDLDPLDGLLGLLDDL